MGNTNSSEKPFRNIAEAIEYGNLTSIKEFIEIKKVSPNTKYRGDTLLHLTVSGGDRYLDILDYLVSKGADIYALDDVSNTPLQQACVYYRPEIVEYFIFEHRMNPNSTGQFGMNTVNLATFYRNLDTVKILVENANADIYATDNYGLRPLDHAELDEKKESIDYLRSKMNLKEKLPFINILKAIESESLEGVRFFIEKEKLNPKCIPLVFCVPCFNRTLLFPASERSNLEIIKYLINKGVDIYAHDSYGNQAIHFACMNDRIENVKYYLDLKMEPNTRGQDEKTCLHLSAERGYFDLVKFLVEEVKVDLYLKDVNNQTAADCAKNEHMKEIENYLRAHMKNFTLSMNDQSAKRSKSMNLKRIDNQIELVKSISSENSNSRIGNQKSNLILNLEHVDWQSTLMLFNVLVRKFTNQKFFTQYHELNWMNANISALNIVSKFEEIMNKISIEFYLPICDFDSTQLISSLTRHLRYGELKKILELLMARAEKNCKGFEKNAILLKEINKQLEINLKKILIEEFELIWPKNVESTIASNGQRFVVEHKNQIQLENAKYAKLN